MRKKLWFKSVNADENIRFHLIKEELGKMTKSKIFFTAVIFVGMALITACDMFSDSAYFNEDEELIVDGQSALEGS
jgi:hypothetical protein